MDMEAQPAALGDTAGSKRLSGLFDRQSRALPTDDVLHVMLPLMRAVAGLHAGGKVAELGINDVIEQVIQIIATRAGQVRADPSTLAVKCIADRTSHVEYRPTLAFVGGGERGGR